MKNVFVYTTSYGIAPNWYLQLYYNFCGTDLYENTGLWYKNVSTDLHGKTCTGTKTVVQICMGRPALVQMAVLTSHAAAFQKLWKPQTAP